MKMEFIKAARHGKVVKVQEFETDKGKYTINLVRYQDNIYFFKFLNGNIVECDDLKLKRNGRKNNDDV